jgi:hypothetical protein
VNLFDLIPWTVPGPEPAPGRNRTEDIAGGVVVFGFPMVQLLLLTVTDLSKRPDMALLWLPLMFALAGAMVCVLARVSLSRSIVAVLGCIWWCMLAGLTLVVIDILIFPF